MDVKWWEVKLWTFPHDRPNNILFDRGLSHTLQEEHAILTDPSMNFFLKFSQNFLAKARLKKKSQKKVIKLFKDQSEVSVLPEVCLSWILMIIYHSSRTVNVSVGAFSSSRPVLELLGCSCSRSCSQNLDPLNRVIRRGQRGWPLAMLGQNWWISCNKSAYGLILNCENNFTQLYKW